jgi:hypothetical protein
VSTSPYPEAVDDSDKRKTYEGENLVEKQRRSLGVRADRPRKVVGEDHCNRRHGRRIHDQKGGPYKDECRKLAIAESEVLLDASILGNAETELDE